MNESIFLLLLVFAVVAVAALFFAQRRQGDGASWLEEYKGRISGLEQTLREKEEELRDAHAQLAAREQQLFHAQEVLRNQKAEWEENRRRMQTEFENLANRLLEEKSQRFTAQNAAQLQQVLLPLREKIREFEENVERKFLEETREKTGLRKELEQLARLNQQLSQDAHNLSAALKGQSKVQGYWGETQLEVLLEKSGLQKGVHFVTQQSLRDQDGALRRPDFIVHLPGNRSLIIDAKVSLTAFERFYNETDERLRNRHLTEHVESLRRHVSELSAKNYQQLRQVDSADYLLIFVPLDGALNAALQADPNLATEALERNVMLVSNGSLLVALRAVAHVWRQEKQARSVLEIARQSGLLYDKFVAFVEDLRRVGASLDQARGSWDAAMHKMTNAVRPGDTLIGKAQKIRELGAKATKSLPEELIDEVGEE